MNLVPDTTAYDFYASADLSRYAGEWVAIIGKKVVAHAKSVKSLLENVKETAPGETPFIARVPAKEIVIW